MLRIISQQLILLLFPLCLLAQPNKPFDSYNVITGTTFQKQYTTAGTTVIIQTPQHAQSYSLSNNGSNYTFNYTPNPSFFGKDYAVIEYYPVYPGAPSYISLELIVVKSVVTTRTDYSTTTKNQTILIPVLDNDETSSTGLTLSANIPYVTHGTAAPSGNQISFTPENNFTGIANVNYIACDAQNTCRAGSVVIKINDNSLLLNDTIRYTVSKNAKVNIFMGLGGGYTTTNPLHGTLTNAGVDVETYQVNTNYSGADNFTATKTINGTDYKKTVLINVFNNGNGNHFAIDDYAATPKNKDVTLNLLANDIGTYTVLNPNTMVSPNGTIQYLGNGNVKFTPNNNFTGTATFKYKVGFPGYAPIETGNVSVEVSDQIPVSSTFNLITLKTKPLVIKYFVPFSGWTFNVDDPADNGNVVVYNGQQTITLDNQQIPGYNMVVYTPNSSFVNNTDEFSLNYCTSTGVCSIIKVKVFVQENPNPGADYCQSECVWAGDTDGDGVVGVKDILPVAMCMGVPGQERSNPTIDWQAQFGENWSNPYEAAPADLKHIDTDGDGIITLNDTIAVSESYGKVHQIPNNAALKLGDKNLIFIPRDTSSTPGDDAIIDVYFGTQSKPVYDAHGLAFKFNYLNNPLITPNKVHMLFDNDNWMVKDASSLSMTKFPENGTMQVAYGRTGNSPISGFGKLGIVIVEDMEGGKTDENGFITFKVEDISYLNDNGEYINLPSQEIRIKLVKNAPNNNPVADKDIVIYPNPSSQYINVASSNGVQVNKSKIISLTGQLLESSVKTNMDISSLTPGFYFIQLETNKGIITKKFEKTH